jgi:flagellar biosynthesis protein FlhF
MAGRSATVLAFPGEAQSPRGAMATALRRHRLPELLIEDLLKLAAVWPGYEPAEALACALAGRMKIEAIDFERARGILLVGPSGAGKSAVAAKIERAAKLAGRATAMTGAVEGLALFRSGTYRPDTLTVMEAEGFNPLNARAAAAFSALGSIAGVETIGVVSALHDAEDVSDIVAALRLKRVIVTGLDRTKRLGAAVAAVTGSARLAHVTHGPRPDDALESLEPDALAEMLLKAERTD